MKKAIFKTTMVFAILFAFSIIGFSPAFGYGGIPTPPSSISVVNRPMTILPSQEGTLTNNFGQQGSVVVIVPQGAVNSQTTFRTQMSAANANQRPDSAEGAFMIGNKVFNVTATDRNNNNIGAFEKDITITFQLPDLPPETSGLGVYWFNASAGQWELVPGAIFEPATGKVTIKVNHLTIFSIIKGNLALTIGLEKDAKTTGKPAETPKPKKDEVQVLGLEYYGDGTLLRGKNKRIYLIIGENKEHIRTLEELAKHAGRPIIDVDDEVLEQYGEVSVLGKKGIGEGALIRGKDKKVFVIKNGKKHHIRTMQELGLYAGQPIHDVVDEELTELAEGEGEVEEEAIGEEEDGIGEGSLIRGKDKKVFVIKNGVRHHIRTMQELGLYAGQPILDVDDVVLNRFSGGKGFADGVLVRLKNKNVYVIKRGIRHHIRSLQELHQYAGQPIIDIDDETLDEISQEEGMEEEAGQEEEVTEENGTEEENGVEENGAEEENGEETENGEEAEDENGDDEEDDDDEEELE